MNKRTHALTAIVGLAAMAGDAFASPSITIDKVAQRWPWNNNVDITYTISDGTDLASATRAGDGYLKVVFTAKVGNDTYTIDGASDVIANVDSGTHTVTWTNAPAGVKMTNCEMYATLYDIDAYYMIIDLNTGKYAFDTLQGSDTATAWPSAAAERFNTDLYKTDMLVLRRVPRTSKANAAYSSGYRTGCDTHYGAESDATYKNSATNWVTDRDFFVGIFAISYGQYAKVMKIDTTKPLKPFYGANQTWNTFRNSNPPDSPLSANASSGSFYERLNALVGISSGFDMPTEVMAEIVKRGGKTTHYIWGDSWNINAVSPRYANGPGDVGCSANSHPWGFYNTVGNGFEWCLDSAARPNMADAPDPWTPYASENSDHMTCYGPSWWTGSGSDAQARLSHRHTFSSSEISYRVSYVAR